MDEVIPSIYQERDVEGLDAEGYDGLAFNNMSLRVGEVVQIVYPEDEDSRTKVFIEYNVLVQHRENDTAITKLYENCLMVNPLAGLADRARWLLRTDTRAVTTDDKRQPVEDSVGSKVLLLCINGEHASAVIMGGIRDDKDTDKGLRPNNRSQPHAFLNFEYNGIAADIDDDGSFTLTYKGATKADGTPRDGVDDSAVGASVKLTQDGTFTAGTKDAQEHITLDRGAKTATLHGPTVKLGNNAEEFAVLGNTLVELMAEFIDIQLEEQHGSAVGPTSIPLNAPKLVALRAKLRTMLSQFVKVAKTP